MGLGACGNVDVQKTAGVWGDSSGGWEWQVLYPSPPQSLSFLSCTRAVWEDGEGSLPCSVPGRRDLRCCSFTASHRCVYPSLNVTGYFDGFASEATQSYLLLLLPQLPPLKREMGLRTDGSSQLILEEPRKEPSVFTLVPSPNQSQLPRDTHTPHLGPSPFAGLTHIRQIRAQDIWRLPSL